MASNILSYSLNGTAFSAKKEKKTSFRQLWYLVGIKLHGWQPQWITLVLPSIPVKT